ncbi:MAG TPA: hypothetical protein VFK05_00885 [Polyangiaceae bacterium]|nr:hypothetical protein [Polyangiaceae bacterium]
MSRWRALVGVGAVLGLVACSHPPPRLSVELTARANAKASVVPLVVSDPTRAARLRSIYREVVRLGREFDQARAAARAECRAAAAGQKPASAASDPIASGALECLIAPPLGEKDRAALAAYSRLMVEARSQLTQREFDKLARMR